MIRGKIGKQVSGGMEKGQGQTRPSKRRAALFLFSVAIGCYCAYLTYNGSTVQHPSSAALPLTIGRLQKSEEFPAPQNGYEEIEEIRKKLDTLEQSIRGREIKDSILKHYPALMERIKELEQNKSQQ